MADTPLFTIDNGYEHREQYDPIDPIVTDTFEQRYNLDWGESFSNRLDVDLQFELSIKDIHNSQDIDTKEVFPSLNIGVFNPIWDLSIFADDSIEYTNELNKGPRSGKQFGAQLNVVPYLMPDLQVTYDVVLNDQENLEDTLEKKLDIASSYTFGWLGSLSAFWIGKTLDDRINDFNDKDSQSWGMNLNLNQLLTPTIKLNFDISLDGETEETLNNAGTVISTDESKDLENRLRLTLNSFPGILSDLSVTNNRDLVNDIEEKNLEFSFETFQQFLFVGDLVEKLKISRDQVINPDPQDDSTEYQVQFDVGFIGQPSKFLEYLISQSFEFTDSEFGDSSLNTDTRSDEFDFTVTVFPTERIDFNISFNQSAEYKEGSRTAEDKEFKFDIVYNDELLNVPNMIFIPTLRYATTNDFVSNVKTTTDDVDLRLIYGFNLPSPFIFIIEPSYSLSHKDGQTTDEEITLDYELSGDFRYSEWSIFLEYIGDYTNPLSGDGEVKYNSTTNIQVVTELIGNLFFDAGYKFKTSTDKDNQDVFDVFLSWRLLNMDINLSYGRSRTYSTEKNETETYRAQFYMEF